MALPGVHFGMLAQEARNFSIASFFCMRNPIYLHYNKKDMVSGISVVLVGPKYSGNLGAVARAMKNFGFSRLVITGPKEVDFDAEVAAVHAKDVLEKLKRYGSFDAARKDFDYLVGTSGQRTKNDDHFHRLGVGPHELRGILEGKKGRIGVVFGPEDSGLSNSELKKCDVLVQIPTSSAYPIMNLSHAVAVVLYELSGIGSGEVKVAGRKEMETLSRELEKTIRFVDIKRVGTVKLVFERVFGRAVLTGREVNSIIGVFRRANKRIGKKS